MKHNYLHSGTFFENPPEIFIVPGRKERRRVRDSPH